VDARGLYAWAPGKLVAVVGIDNLVVIDTGDALLVTTKERSQDVKAVVDELTRDGREELL
jgi:mannose-1-phosphate guanylyltransferase